MWDEWKRLTRFMESARIALLREKTLWDSLELKDADKAKVHVVNGESTYQATLDQHRTAIEDEWLFCASMLSYSYALAEAAASDALQVNVTDLSGIEHWGTQLLARSGNPWTDVKDGKEGAVEIAIVRNAISHGQGTYTQSNIERMKNVGATPSWKDGDIITLDYETLKEYRARLKSLLRVAKV